MEILDLLFESHLIIMKFIKEDYEKIFSLSAFQKCMKEFFNENFPKIFRNTENYLIVKEFHITSRKILSKR